MTEHQAGDVAYHIGNLFPTVSPPVITAIKQELMNGVYDADKVIAWANWRNAETSAFALSELRQHFINDQPKRNTTDARTAAWRRQRDQIEADFAKGKPELDRMQQFIADCTDQDLDELKNEYLMTVPAETRQLLEKREVRSSMFLKNGIYAMVKSRSAVQA